MKKNILLSFLLLFTVCLAVLAQGDYSVFKWTKGTTHDFGTIEQNKPVTANFKFTNESNIPMIISNARGSCGCTGVKFPTEPIAPGEASEISATFNAAAVGDFHKTVTVNANTADGSTTLIIKGKVAASGGGGE